MKYGKTLNIILVAISLVGGFSQAQASERVLGKYQEAEALYTAKKYDKALQIFDAILPLLQGKQELVQVKFYKAFALFYEKSYKNSAYCFKEFYENYPKRPEAEAALYMQAYALYHLKPKPEFDQTDTEVAITLFRHYLDKYPEGIYREDSLNCIKQLQMNLTHKAFLNAAIYYNLAYYQAAVVALNSFQAQFPTAPEKMEAAYLKVKAQGKVVNAAQGLEQESSLKNLVGYCQEFLDNYPQSVHNKEIQYIYKNLLIKIKQLSIDKRYN
jgi:outer membrane protein assembly factor BamD